jgi:hypothetical protein
MLSVYDQLQHCKIFKTKLEETRRNRNTERIEREREKEGERE